MLHSIDEHGRLVAVSDAWLAKLGYSREEVIGRRSSDFLTPESRTYAIKEILPRFFQTGRIDDVEYQMVRKDGGVIDVLLSAVLDTSSPDSGNVSLAVVTDVTALKTAKRLLSASEERYRGLVEDQTELVSLASPEGELRFVNHAYARHYGLQPHDMIGRSLFDFIPEEGRAAVAEHLRTVCSVNWSLHNENQVILPNGQVRWMAWTNRATVDAEGRIAIHSVGHDIDERVAAERRLQMSEARYRLLADHSTDMVFQLDLDFAHRYVSPACREILGHEPEQLIGMQFVSFAHSEDAERIAVMLPQLLNNHKSTVICRFHHRDGYWIWVEAQLKALRDPDTGTPTGIIGTLRDVSERKAIEEQLQDANRRLQQMAEEDWLTGLANRRFFDSALSRELHSNQLEGRKIALLMIDVDLFKSFNDRYGHLAGDDCLKQIGRAIKTAVASDNSVAARYGGEEFAVLLPDTDQAEATVIAEQIRQSILHLAIPHELNPNLVATISIGVAALPTGAPLGSETLLREADRALYRAKDSGRNRVVAG
ncbi:sensor domain-containing diguanylate cyclase (plasmid) [Rhizobium sp. CCGE531]|nr:sensor domain-containing diguanylate cyclase [Rhizobium sp. CCGE531]AYG76644.1 sensor domain-containing diguanylate cyclase [Rhizobium sp. CCGE532]